MNVPIDYEFGDFDAMTDAWKALGWGAEYRQLDPGPFHGRMLMSVAGATKILRSRWTSGIQHHGLQPKGTLSLAPTLLSQGQGRFMGEPIGADDVIVQAGHTSFELAGAATWEAAVFELSESAVAEELAAITQRDPRSILERQGLARLAPRTSARIRAACLAYFDAVERGLASARASAALPGMACDLVSLVVGAVAEAQIDPVPAPRASRCRRIVREAEEFAAGCGAGRLRIPDLCRELEVSERSLRYAFGYVLDVSPAAYFKAQRLNRVRAVLRDCDPSQTLVKQVAYEHGFWHLGQFSQDYRNLFGEPPSETLSAA